jgi:hypothetical protein
MYVCGYNIITTQLAAIKIRGGGTFPGFLFLLVSFITSCLLVSLSLLTIFREELLRQHSCFLAVKQFTAFTSGFDFNVLYIIVMLAPKLQRSHSCDMSPPRPLLSSQSKEYANLNEESAIISSTKVYYAKQYNKYKTRKKVTKNLTLSMTNQHFLDWSRKRGNENISSHFTRKEFQVE